MRSFSRILLFMLLGLGTIVMNSCQNDNNEPEPDPNTSKLVKDYSSDIAIEWTNIFLEADQQSNGYRPGPAPRALAYVGLALYEASVPGMPEYRSIAKRYQGLNIPKLESGQEVHWPTVFNSVYSYMMKKLFQKVDGNQTFMSKVLATEQYYDDIFYDELGFEVFNRSKNYGLEVADAVWNYSTTDPYSHEAYLDPRPASYNPPVAPGLWLPTYPDYGKAVFPYWGKARLFALPENEKLGRAPLAYSEDPRSAFYVQAMEVVSLTQPQPTYENEWIAEFWSDDRVGLTFSPPARFLAIGAQVLVTEKSNLETAIFMFVKLGLALNDAGVSCWHTKYTFNIERPVSYIRRVIDPSYTIPWLPFTPSFPAYPSGHSTFGAAGAEVLTDIFGDNYAMVDHCHEKRTEFNGKPRPFDSFYDMAQENAFSRIPLGVHFRMDAEEGLRLGYLCGRRVNELPFKK